MRSSKKKLSFLPPKLQNVIAEKFIVIVGSLVVISLISITLSLLFAALPLFYSPSSSLISTLKPDQVFRTEQEQNLQANLIYHFADAKQLLTIHDNRELNLYSVDAGTLLTSYKFPIDYSWASFDDKGLLYTLSQSPDGGKIEEIYQPSISKAKIELELLKTIKIPEGVLIHKSEASTTGYTSLNLFSDGTGEFAIEKEAKNFLGEAKTETSFHKFQSSIANPKFAILSNEQNSFIIVGEHSELESWKIDGTDIFLNAKSNFDFGQPTAVNFVFADISIALGTANNKIYILQPDPKEKSFHLRRTLEAPIAGEIAKINHSRYNRSILAQIGSNDLYFYYSTTGKELLKLHSPSIIRGFYLGVNFDRLFVIDNLGTINAYKLDIPHPEASLNAYFGKLDYENYFTPTYTWQSSAAVQSFEPKLSLIPLIIGSLKGTFYAMFIALPLALLGAIYLSQFASATVRKYFKPIVEMMSSLPSVVVGFIAALWLGPKLEEYLLEFFLFFLVFLPISLVAFYYVLRVIDKASRISSLSAKIIYFVIPSILLAVLMSYLSGSLIDYLFNFDLKTWLFQSQNVHYEQQNAILTAIALSFASIPIIFSISDDALRLVPASFRAASLALGANNWQTIINVIIPAASPGIFAAFMLGTARAVGETMIVLMASGNTPINSFGLFDGMRTLAANIAVEIPEAAVGGTLYRTLFLSGLMLFTLTFILNFLAELVRSRLQIKNIRN